MLISNIIVQARMRSTRLPGKMMLDLYGSPIISHILTRLKKCTRVKEIILAIPTGRDNDILAEVAMSVGNIKIERGSEINLIERFYIAAKAYPSEFIIRFPADNIFPDPKQIDCLIDFHQQNNRFGFSSNIASVFGNKMIDGVGAEIFSFDLLEKIVKANTSEEQREHLHLNFYDYAVEKAVNPEVPVMAPKPKPSLQRPEYALDINTIDQYIFIRDVYRNVCLKNPDYTTAEIINYLDNRKKD